LASINKAIRRSEIGRGAADLIRAATRNSTKKSYDARLKIFYAWCADAGLEPTTTPVKAFCNFVTPPLYTKEAAWDQSRIQGCVQGILIPFQTDPRWIQPPYHLDDYRDFSETATFMSVGTALGPFTRYEFVFKVPAERSVFFVTNRPYQEDSVFVGLSHHVQRIRDSSLLSGH
jgi:hypothetical protein